MARRPESAAEKILALERERQRALAFLQNIIPEVPAVAPRNTLYDQLTVRNMFSSYEAMIQIMFGYQIGLDLARHHEETLWKIICLVSGILILYLFSHSGFLLAIMPSFVNFTRRRSLATYALVVTVALLYYILMMMQESSYKMFADYIALHLTFNNSLIVGLLQPINGDGGFPSTFCFIGSTVVIFHSQEIFQGMMNGVISGAVKMLRGIKRAIRRLTN